MIYDRQCQGISSGKNMYISVGEQWPPPHLLLGGLIATVAHQLSQT